MHGKVRRSGLPVSTDCWPRTPFPFARHEICSPNSTFSVQLPVHHYHPPPPPAVMATELWKNKLRNMRHGRWQTHGHIVTETDGVSAEWFDTTDSHFPILTSSMQAIRKDRRQKLCETQHSQENSNASVKVQFMSRMSGSNHWKHVLLLRGESMYFRALGIISADMGLVSCTKKDKWADLLTWTFLHSSSISPLLPFLHSREHKLWVWLKINEINDRKMS